ncbi:type II toxin-antitoxin system antitoxin DNA ADP-ribosyl glycohydrolase DarG [Chromobacterium paludis]|uniref:Macro domain-containing protein n=1 Tax=Chromobacterium paludis TaxID=2605945 RepID=A0A5C1DL59_9NEIS|nr:macro domain-containing protein [Chromobacterium paludis]QEL57333.1 macro domain-containing protein [Chromobacterium paludis]
MAIETMRGDLLRQEDVDAIVNTVNCVGVMGKGIALQFKHKWPANFQAYQAACRAGTLRPGKMFIHDNGALAKPHYIVNFPTKDHWRGSSKLEYIQDGLQDLVAQIRQLSIRSIAIPPLGCGNGRLDWAEVRPLIEQAFAALPNVTVRLFEPAGSPAAHSMEVRTARPRMTPGRAAILKVLDTYRELNYGLTKVEVQKLAYFLQAAGQDLRLTFVKHQFGPYSDQLRHALTRMEGHFIRGLGDGVSSSEIEPIPEALAEADAFITESQAELGARVERVSQLIEGFQSPYGMELLATVHWVATHEPSVHSTDEAFHAIQAWNDRKKKLMRPEQVAAAWQQLQDLGWLPGASATQKTTLKSTASIAAH